MTTKAGSKYIRAMRNAYDFSAAGPNPYATQLKKAACVPEESDVEKAWGDEVERRHAEIESGTISLLPGDETLARLRAEFQ